MEPRDAHQREQMNLQQLMSEDHVRESFRVADILANGQPISAGLALQAAVIVSSAHDSEAYKALAAMLPSANVPRPSNAEARHDLTDLRLNQPLLAAYSVAMSLRTSETFWGRDYITTTLLAADPSLKRIVVAEDLLLDDCRDDWFTFVTLDKRHRRTDEWKQWWYKARVPLPEERTVPPTGRTYLLTWKPALTPFAEIESVAQRVTSEGTAVSSWSVGREGLSPGDRVFFMRHCEDRPGLVGSGWIVGKGL